MPAVDVLPGWITIACTDDQVVEPLETKKSYVPLGRPLKEKPPSEVVVEVKDCRSTDCKVIVAEDIGVPDESRRTPIHDAGGAAVACTRAIRATNITAEMLRNRNMGTAESI
jgi:precorrin-6B methylase 1